MQEFRCFDKYVAVVFGTVEKQVKTCDPRHSTRFSQLYTWPQWKCGWTATCETSEQALSPLLCGRMSCLTQAFAAAPFNSPF
jgi:hypothetical protein